MREQWPEPTEEQPSIIKELAYVLLDGLCHATDGCQVESDETCPHGHPSWLMRLGIV